MGLVNPYGEISLAEAVKIERRPENCLKCPNAAGESQI